MKNWKICRKQKNNILHQKCKQETGEKCECERLLWECLQLKFQKFKDVDHK